jgi:uncharacterized membrane protein YdcZ (DUF606 family)
MIAWPDTEDAVYAWIFGLMVGYLVTAYGIVFARLGREGFSLSGQAMVSRVFDSATFAGSVVLLIGIVNRDVLAAIGNTKPFLLIGGLVGIVYSLHAIATVPPGKRSGESG